MRSRIVTLQDLNVRRNIVRTLQQLNPSVSSIELNDVLRPTEVVVGHKFTGKTLPLKLSQESDGFRRFYAHLLALFSARRSKHLSLSIRKTVFMRVPCRCWLTNSSQCLNKEEAK